MSLRYALRQGWNRTRHVPLGASHLEVRAGVNFDAPRRAERTAFERMLAEAGKAWAGIAAQATAARAAQVQGD